MQVAVWIAVPAATAAAPSAAQVERAAAWGAARSGAVSWAIVDGRGRVAGRSGARLYPSLSVSKALMLVAALRRFPREPVPAGLRRLLEPMIRVSGNRAARAVHRRLGDGAFRTVARATGMRRLATNGRWSQVQVCAADVARFFLRADRAVPERHRAYARALLSGIVPKQSWGIPRVLRPAGWQVFFKGGWHGGRIVHQGALAEQGGRRVALAVLTARNPTHDYGRGTIEGIARRLLTDQGA
jgi:hypothetical protein